MGIAPSIIVDNIWMDGGGALDGGRRSFGQERRLWTRDKTAALVN